MAAAVFTNHSTQVKASTYFGIDASTAQVTYYTAGAVQYWVYSPSTTAIDAAGLTGQPLPVVVFWPVGAGAVMGTSGTPLGNDEGLQMVVDANVLGGKLGFGTNRLGLLAAPIQTWSTIVVFPQFVAAWTGSAPSGRNNRANFAIHDAVMTDVLANFNCDRKRIYAAGVSNGAFLLWEYTYAKIKYPTRYLIDYAAWITVGGCISGSGYRQDLPEMIQGEGSTNQTIPKIARDMAKRKQPMWMFVSAGDAQTTPALYNPTINPIGQFTPLSPAVAIPAGQSAGTKRVGGSWFTVTEFIGAGQPSHQGDWDLAFGNNVTSGAMLQTDPLWAWMLKQSLHRDPVRTATSQVVSYAGGSFGPPVSASGLGAPVPIRRRRR